VKKLRILLMSFLLVAVVVPLGSVALAQTPPTGANLSSNDLDCKGIYTEATDTLLFGADWHSPYHDQATLEYYLSIPPLTLGFIREVTPTQTADHGTQVITATPQAMWVLLLDSQGNTLARSRCHLLVQ